MSAITPVFAGVELGGTKCICILGSGPLDIHDQLIVATGDDSALTLHRIADQLKTWSDKQGPIAGLGIGSFGPLDRDLQSSCYGHITSTSKPGWRNTAVVSVLQAALDTPTRFDTDVNGALLAEQRWGAAQNLADAAYVTIGTGVGVGLIVNGALVHGFAHPELGHIRVARLPGDRSPGACKFHGDCVEGLASGPAIALYAGAAANLLRPEHPVWERVTHAIGQLLHCLILSTAPRKIILAGGVMQSRPELLERVRGHLIESLHGYLDLKSLTGPIADYIVSPGLGAKAGPVGALALAMDALHAG